MRVCKCVCVTFLVHKDDLYFAISCGLHAIRSQRENGGFCSDKDTRRRFCEEERKKKKHQRQEITE